MAPRRTTIYFPAELHRELRRQAGVLDTTISELVVRAVRVLLGRNPASGQLAEPAPPYGGPEVACEPTGQMDQRPAGLLAAVGAWEDIEGLDELEAILASARQQARERDVEPLRR